LDASLAANQEQFLRFTTDHTQAHAEFKNKGSRGFSLIGTDQTQAKTTAGFTTGFTENQKTKEGGDLC
jgi:hypothetical protein